MTEPTDLVVMRHPDLPDQPIEVPASVVEGHETAGWHVDTSGQDELKSENFKFGEQEVDNTRDLGGWSVDSPTGQAEPDFLEGD